MLATFSECFVRQYSTVNPMLNKDLKESQNVDFRTGLTVHALLLTHRMLGKINKLYLKIVHIPFYVIPLETSQVVRIKKSK